MDSCLVNVVCSTHAFGETEEQPEWSYGYIDSTDDGRLILVSSKDSRQRIDLVLQSDADNDHLLNLGDLYHIKRYHIIKEDLSYKGDSGDKTDLDCAYMFCDINDLTSILRSRIPAATFYLEESANMHKVSHFLVRSPTFRLDSEKMNAILYILDIQRTTANYNAKGKIYVESHVRAVRYHLGYANRKQRLIRTPAIITLILRSDKKSMNDLPYFRVGQLVALLDADQSQRFETNLTFCKNKSLDMPDVYILEHEKYRLAKVVRQQNDGCIGLEAIEADQNIQALTALPRVFHVSDVIHAKRDAENGCGDISMVYLEGGLYESLLSVKGIVVVKEFRERRDVEGLSTPHAGRLFDNLRIGTGKADRILFVRLRQIDGLDTLDIYIDVTRQYYPLGLVPGFFVTFHHLARRKANNLLGFYCLALKCTTIEVCSTPRTDSISTEQIPSCYLGEILEQEEEANRGLMMKITCEIESILLVSLSWQCLDCGSAVSRNMCLNGCQNARRLFLANAIVVVSDGSSEAHAILDGEELVFKMLLVSTKQIEAIKDVVLESGTISCGYWATANSSPDEEQLDSINGLTLQDMCNRIRRTTTYHIFGRAFPKRKAQPDSEDLLDKLGCKSMDMTFEKETLRTIVPKEELRIKVVSIEYLDPLTAVEEALQSIDD
ncbi:CST complex subunit ctc1 [Apophysomyces ossiformis]|uniref:CST complex subunit CTC1 n=1 Tax=Apophysomyces ossiformis TaxID=679940 RepID=A0A8H7ENJ8_9FUNG|nr:CST complex subunit ctc1 [Apophysomyces ossiformis]